MLMSPSLCVCSKKIPTGNATDDSWNISESPKVQRTLASIISQWIERQRRVQTEREQRFEYIRTFAYDTCLDNISETIVFLISDYIGAPPLVDTVTKSKVPEYIESLFCHYCSRNIKPRFDGIDQIQQKMVMELQQHIFVEIVDPRRIYAKDMENMPVFRGDDVKQKVSHEKVQRLFPNAAWYINEKSEQNVFDKGISLMNAR